MNKSTGYPLKDFYNRIYKSYDLVNRIFTLGQDERWRKATARECLEGEAKDILDLCCGTGDLTLRLAEMAEGKVNITGYDFNESMLKVAHEKMNKRKLSGLKFICGSAASMPFQDRSFDSIGITFGFRNLTYNNPEEAKHISEIFRVLKPGGKLVIMESGQPSNWLIRIFYLLYLYLILIPLGGLISGNFKAYTYLARSSSQFYSLPELETLLKEYGFKTVGFRKFFLGAANLIVAVS